MARKFDVVVVGAGPAGMSAAILMSRYGLSVMVFDEQPAPGGQIWRSVENLASTQIGRLLGKEFQLGADLVARFRACDAVYEPFTQVWQIEPGWRVLTKRNGQVDTVIADHVVLATGAQERPAPFPGWELPGVLTVGAAQILLKTSHQVPSQPVWVAGHGPLPFLYMAQLLRAGGEIAGWLDTTPPGGWRRALPWAGSALLDLRELLKGAGWIHQIRRSGVRRVRNVTSFSASGDGRLEEVEFTQSDGMSSRVKASVLLSHQGVVPSIHVTQALGCSHRWSEAQACLAPVLDEWGQSSLEGVFVAGDGAGIGGAKVACIRGELVGLRIAQYGNKISPKAVKKEAGLLRKQLQKRLRLRPMLDALYPPRPGNSSPTDNTIVCRCEELTAGEIRAACASGASGLDHIKALTRAGMGPCQGRQCAYTVANILSSVQDRDVSGIGFYKVRPPLKPLTLGELASMPTDNT